MKSQNKHYHRDLKMLYSKYSMFKYLDFFKIKNFCRKLKKMGWAVLKV